jgi:hypothetical protein
MLAYAGQGLAGDEAASQADGTGISGPRCSGDDRTGGELHNVGEEDGVNRQKISGLHSRAGPRCPFVAGSARTGLAQPVAQFAAIDQPDTSIHRALLTDLFLFDEIYATEIEAVTG